MKVTMQVICGLIPPAKRKNPSDDARDSGGYVGLRLDPEDHPDMVGVPFERKAITALFGEDVTEQICAQIPAKYADIVRTTKKQKYLGIATKYLGSPKEQTVAKCMAELYEMCGGVYTPFLVTNVLQMQSASRTPMLGMLTVTPRGFVKLQMRSFYDLKRFQLGETQSQIAWPNIVDSELDDRSKLRGQGWEAGVKVVTGDDSLPTRLLPVFKEELEVARAARVVCISEILSEMQDVKLSVRRQVMTFLRRNVVAANRSTSGGKSSFSVSFDQEASRDDPNGFKLLTLPLYLVKRVAKQAAAELENGRIDAIDPEEFIQSLLDTA